MNSVGAITGIRRRVFAINLRDAVRVAVADSASLTAGDLRSVQVLLWRAFLEIRNRETCPVRRLAKNWLKSLGGAPNGETYAARTHTRPCMVPLLPSRSPRQHRRPWRWRMTRCHAAVEEKDEEEEMTMACAARGKPKWEGSGLCWRWGREWMRAKEGERKDRLNLLQLQ